MSRHPCSGCGLYRCEGQCFDECPADYAEDDGGMTIEEARKRFGSQLGTPFSELNRAAGGYWS